MRAFLPIWRLARRWLLFGGLVWYGCGAAAADAVPSRHDPRTKQVNKVTRSKATSPAKGGTATGEGGKLHCRDCRPLPRLWLPADEAARPPAVAPDRR